jgi:predicted nucleic acid-binding protein
VIYVDTSVALAEVLAEDRTPPAALWNEPLISSRLIEYEVWVRLHARKLADSHGDQVRSLLARLALVELVTPVLVRALDPFPAPVRTPDALHLASLVFLREQGVPVQLATYDHRMRAAARRLRIPLYRL